jgi:hypothetical protein
MINPKLPQPPCQNLLGTLEHENSFERASMKKASSLVLLLIVALFVGLPFFGTIGRLLPNMSFTKSYSANAVFYRVKTLLKSGDEDLVFDVVVGCDAQVTTYKDGDSGTFAKQFPIQYALPTKDGHAVLVGMPEACFHNESTANGMFPRDYLIPVVWFEHADDLSLGYLYMTEDAYDGPRSKLKYLGTTVTRVKAVEFDAWLKTEEPKNLIKRATIPWDRLPPDLSKYRDSLLNDPKSLWKYSAIRQCSTVLRIKMSPEMQAYIQSVKPKTAGKYWFISPDLDLAQFDEIVAVMYNHKNKNVKTVDWSNPLIAAIKDKPFDGQELRNLVDLSPGLASGLPRKNGSGYIRGNPKAWDDPRLTPEKAFSTEAYPLISSEGLPWFKDEGMKQDFVRWSTTPFDASWKGFAACYDYFDNYYFKLPERPKMTAFFEVNGQKITEPNRQPANGVSSMFIFDDEGYLIVPKNFNLI